MFSWTCCTQAEKIVPEGLRLLTYLFIYLFIRTSLTTPSIAQTKSDYKTATE
jgi:hypothetical protein